MPSRKGSEMDFSFFSLDVKLSLISEAMHLCKLVGYLRIACVVFSCLHMPWFQGRGALASA